MASSTASPEYRTLKQSYRLLVDIIKESPDTICDALIAKEYVSPSKHDDFAAGISPAAKARALLNSVLRKVKHHPEVYHGFVEILCN